MLFNKDTFFPDVKVKSIYLHDVRRGLQTRWKKETQAGSYKACYHVPLFGDSLSAAKKTFTVPSLHIGDIYAKKRGIGKKLILTIRAVMLDEKVDLVAGDFNGAALRSDNSNNIRIIEEAFADFLAETSRSHTLVGSRGSSGYVGGHLWIPQSS